MLPTARQAEALALQRAPLLLRQADTGLDALLRTRPYRVGENTFELRLRDRNNLPVADADVELTFLPLITFPNFTFAETASNVVVGPHDVVDGRPARVVTFVLNLAGSQSRYAVWIDLDTFRILRESMVARSPYMIGRNHDFDAPLKIRAP